MQTQQSPGEGIQNRLPGGEDAGVESWIIINNPVKVSGKTFCKKKRHSQCNPGHIRPAQDRGVVQEKQMKLCKSVDPLMFYSNPMWGVRIGHRSSEETKTMLQKATRCPTGLRGKEGGVLSSQSQTVLDRCQTRTLVPDATLLSLPNCSLRAARSPVVGCGIVTPHLTRLRMTRPSHAHSAQTACGSDWHCFHPSAEKSIWHRVGSMQNSKYLLNNRRGNKWIKNLRPNNNNWQTSRHNVSQWNGVVVPMNINICWWRKQLRDREGGREEGEF